MSPLNRPFAPANSRRSQLMASRRAAPIRESMPGSAVSFALLNGRHHVPIHGLASRREGRIEVVLGSGRLGELFIQFG